MNEISEETRREANEKVDKTKREIQVLKILSEYKELTAKQVARYMAYRGYTKEIDYNHARPRLTALLEKRQVCIVGKELDIDTLQGSSVSNNRARKKEAKQCLK